MASGKRASMREGPLAQLFRKTEDDVPPETQPREEREPRAEQPSREQRAEQPAREHRPREPRGGQPLPGGGPGPRATRRVPEPQPPQPPPGGRPFGRRATGAARRAEERARRREQEE